MLDLSQRDAESLFEDLWLELLDQIEELLVLHHLFATEPHHLSAESSCLAWRLLELWAGLVMELREDIVNGGDEHLVPPGIDHRETRPHRSNGGVEVRLINAGLSYVIQEVLDIFDRLSGSSLDHFAQ